MTEAVKQLCDYVFSHTDMIRIYAEPFAYNIGSQRVLEKAGFQYEGTFRNAVVYKNRSRDTCWFSMLIEEWPKHKQAFNKWLAEENFDDEGRQLHRLEEFK